MSLRLKFNLIFGLASLLGVLVTGFLAHHLLQQNAREEVLDSARIMLESARAVRGYTVSEVRPLLELQQKRQFLPQTVPAYSARIYINKLQKKYPNYSYKEATLNPTNPVDRATGWEVDIVDWFRTKRMSGNWWGNATRRSAGLCTSANPFVLPTRPAWCVTARRPTLRRP